MTEAQKTPMPAKAEAATVSHVSAPAALPPAAKEKTAVAPSKPAAKKVTKAAAKPRKAAGTVKPAAAVAKAGKPVKTTKTVTVVAPQTDTKAAKPKKPKLVRDSFTIPKAEYAVLDELKQRAAKLGQPAKKSELLRAGIKALAAMDAASFAAALHGVPVIKTGRPKNG